MAVEKRRSNAGWLAGGAVAALLAGSAFFEYWSYGRPTATVDLANATPQAGSLSINDATPIASGGSDNGAVQRVPAAPIDTICAPGVTVISRRALRLYADADDATLVLNQYESNASFVVENASGEYIGYPVERGGKQWCRLRAADGLVGWADESGISK